MRRVAAHEVIEGSTQIHLGAVEIEGDKAERYYQFSGELPRTEWLGGTIEIKNGQAFHNGKLLTE